MEGSWSDFCLNQYMPIIDRNVSIGMWWQFFTIQEWTRQMIFDLSSSEKNQSISNLQYNHLFLEELHTKLQLLISYVFQHTQHTRYTSETNKFHNSFQDDLFDYSNNFIK